MDQNDVYNMLVTSVRAPISTFRSMTLSAMSSRRHSAGEGVEEVAVAKYEEEASETTAATALAGLQLRDQAGVRWRYAEQGRAIHNLAYRNKEDTEFLRKSYIDGVAYMLLGLPADLELHEAAVIRVALPAIMQQDRNPIDEQDHNPVDDGRALGPRRSASEGSSALAALQRGTAMIAAICVVLIHLLVSYATLLITLGAYYERKHNISQQIVTRGFVIVSTVGRHGVELSAKVCGMKDGFVGKAIGSIATQAIKSVASGIQEGIGQGLLLIDTGPGPG
ncbi:hypothetical protein F4678DRAFT_465852 [Xylaria arbuscula]|nr:hypothetical protein F4678DRAFT_465852 [Xylaria arbuscula]